MLPHFYWLRIEYYTWYKKFCIKWVFFRFTHELPIYSVGLLLAQRLRRCPNNKPTLFYIAEAYVFQIAGLMPPPPPPTSTPNWWLPDRRYSDWWEVKLDRCPWRGGEESKKIVSVYFTSEQILSFDCSEQHCGEEWRVKTAICWMRD